MKAKILLLSISFLFLGACSAYQEVTQLSSPAPQSVCVVKHEAVKKEVLEVITKEFQNHGIQPTVLDGNYEIKHNQWIPTWNADQAQSCDSMGFYFARWNWDLATYMSFANIWMTDTAGSKILAQATYDASTAGTSKFINAEEKIQELMREMIIGPTTEE